MDASLLTDPTKFGKIFSEANAGFHWGSSAESNFKGFRSVFQKMIDSINKELEDVTTSAFGRAQEGKQNAHSPGGNHGNDHGEHHISGSV